MLQLATFRENWGQLCCSSVGPCNMPVCDLIRR
jgi:hypothetical protein